MRGGRPWSWITGRPRLVDAVVVMVTFLPALAGPTSVLRHGRDLWVIALSFVQVPAVSLPLWWRRQLPLAAAAVVMAGVLAGLAAGINLNLSAASFAFAFYAVSVYGSDRERPLAAAASTGLTVLGLLLRWGDLTGVGVVALMAWVVGDYFHGRRRHLAELLRDSRREAAEEERLRIARELHDVITHNLSSMAIHAGAARIGGAPGGDAHALQVIESTARETLAELNRLLGVLRKGPGRAELRPQPGLGELDDLVDAAREAGLDAHLVVAGQRRRLPSTLDLSAYRIVQEAVTNTLRHAHAHRIDVCVEYRPDSVVLTVADDGVGATQEALEVATGHGLVGMRERVALFGGELRAGKSPTGGFAVSARLPVPQ